MNELSQSQPNANEFQAMQLLLKHTRDEVEVFRRLSMERYEKMEKLVQENLDVRSHYLSELRKSEQLKNRYMQALTTILALNVHIPDEVFNIANDAINIKGADSNE